MIFHLRCNLLTEAADSHGIASIHHRGIAHVFPKGRRRRWWGIFRCRVKRRMTLLPPRDGGGFAEAAFWKLPRRCPNREHGQKENESIARPWQ
jgi:hypothetical protein